MMEKEQTKNTILPDLLKPEIKEMIKNKKWLELRDILSTWPAPDIADLIQNLKQEEKTILFLSLPKELQTDVFAELDAETHISLLKNLKDDHVKTILSELPPDDRTELFSELSGKMMQKLINILSPEDRKETLLLLGFPKNSVGRLMTPDYVAIKPHWTVKEALNHLRCVGIDAETINMVYVVDNNWHLLDDLPLRKLILSSPEQTIESLMNKQFISINPYADQEEAVKLMEHYHLIALPVIDKEGILLGIVTIDDVLDVIREEQTEDLVKLSAVQSDIIQADIITDLKRIPFKKLYRSRIIWLVLLLIMDVFTGGIIQGFEEIISKYVVLVTFLPVLVDTAGNAGSQSATLLIRALALGTVRIKDWFFLLGKELLIATALGLTMGIGVSFMGIIRSGNMLITKIVVVSMIINVVVGCLIGLSLPFIFAKFKKDPASASTPLITTLADILGTAIYLLIAYFSLNPV